MLSWLNHFFSICEHKIFLDFRKNILEIFCCLYMATFSNKISPKKPPLFKCEQCDLLCSSKKDLKRHLDTKKHIGNKSATIGNTNLHKIPGPTYCCENCGKEYKDRTGLWRHKKKCGVVAATPVKHPETSLALEDYVTDKTLIMMLIKDNNELRKMMLDQQSLMLENNNKVLELCKQGTHHTTHTNTNSNNKAFNLNFFLNETCKNAMNIMEFAESIQLQLSDLEAVGENGYVEGISNIIVKNLKALDITERPIHCADKKREVIYIKDEDKWEKEDMDKKKLQKVIQKVAYKNQRLLSKFKELHPGCNYSESKYADQYSKIVIEAMGGEGNDETEKTNKIITNIAKEVVIDKSIF